VNILDQSVQLTDVNRIQKDSAAHAYALAIIWSSIEYVDLGVVYVIGPTASIDLAHIVDMPRFH